MVHVTKNAHAHSLLVAIKKSSESFSILMTALVRDVANNYGEPSFLFKFILVVLYKLQLSVRAGSMILKLLVGEVTSLCIQINDS